MDRDHGLVQLAAGWLAIWAISRLLERRARSYDVGFI